jgi:putative restriction endonuclease
MSLDHKVRIAAFNWLSEQVAIHSDVLPRKLLETGFKFENKRVPLIAPQGIFKPKILDLPLTITTAPKGPYDDSFSSEGFLLYKYRGTDPSHRDNEGLSKIIKGNIPLIYLHGIVPGKYLAVWPVYIISDDPSNLTFKIAVDDISAVNSESLLAGAVSEETTARRTYITSTIKTRLHQRGFREKVLDAYKTQCALCRLKHSELLDAAHIIPDNEPDSRPTVDNGIALCKLHHAAFDSFMLGITPDYKIEIRKDILSEKDGPVLQHGLKDLHSNKIILPSLQTLWPNQEFLDRRYQKFIATE